MSTANQKRAFTFTSVWFYVIVLVIGVAVWSLQTYVYRAVYGGPGKIFAVLPASPLPPSDWQKLSVEAMSESNRLLTTLGTAMLGALGFVLGGKMTGGSRGRHMWAGFLAATGGGLSLYFGFMSHLNLVAMINNDTFTPYNSVYQFSSHAQFYTLIAGAIFFADFAVHQLRGEATK